MEVLGVGKLLEIRDQKWDEIAERLTVELEVDEQGNSTKRSMSCVLCKVLLVVVDLVCIRCSERDTANKQQVVFVKFMTFLYWQLEQITEL
jgi:hypothetical protein